MSFSFNFDEEGASADTASSLASAALDACADCSIHTDSCEISCPVYVDTTACNSVEFLHYKFGELTIAHISAPFRVTGRIDATHDLIPGQYEGGLKIWECSIDLAVYFVNHPELHGCSVLELGCGHGIPGLAALLSGCRPVIFSDFNDTVLSDITWPNIVKNFGTRPSDKDVRCIAGDWLAMSADLNHGKYLIADDYDLILSAETLYSTESCAKVTQMLLKHLKKGGIALIATKRYYFGVGGGSMDFIGMVSKTRILTALVVAIFENGSSNTREIIQVTAVSA